MRWLEGAGNRNCPSPMWYKTLIKLFFLDSIPFLWIILWAYFAVVNFSCPMSQPCGDLSWFSQEDLVGFLEVKSMKVWGYPHRLCRLGVFHSQSGPQSSSTSLSKLPFKFSHVYWPQWRLLQVSICGLWLFGFTWNSSRFQDGDLPCKLSSLFCPRKVMDFICLDFFLL